MGEKRSNNAPAPVDATATARAQGAANKETAISQKGLNADNQYTPTGSLEWSQNGTWSDGTPRFSVTQTLTPQSQRILDLQQNASETYGQTGNALLDNVKGMLSQPVDMSQFGAQPTYDNAFRDQSFNDLMSRSNSTYDRQRQQLETQLANQGITAGSQAYNDAFQPFYQGLNDATIQSRLNAGNLAGAEYARMIQGRQNQIGEAYMPRQQSLNELAALAGGTQLQAPSFVNTPQTGIANTDVIGAQGLQYSGQQNIYNQQIGQQNAAMGGLFGLGGALGGGYLAGGGKFWGP